MNGAYCRWYHKDFREVTEYDQLNCSDNGYKCEKCPYLKREEEGRQKENA